MINWSSTVDPPDLPSPRATQTTSTGRPSVGLATTKVPRSTLGSLTNWSSSAVAYGQALPTTTLTTTQPTGWSFLTNWLSVPVRPLTTVLTQRSLGRAARPPYLGFFFNYPPQAPGRSDRPAEPRPTGLDHRPVPLSSSTLTNWSSGRSPPKSTPPTLHRRPTGLTVRPITVSGPWDHRRLFLPARRPTGLVTRTAGPTSRSVLVADHDPAAPSALDQLV